MLIAFLALHTSFAPHPVHVSEAEAHWKKSEKTLEISVKLFFNDLEQSLTQQAGQPIYLCPDSANYHRAVVQQYFENCFKLSVNDDKKQFKLLGYECDNNRFTSI